MRAVAKANPFQPRNATMRVASLSEMVKPTRMMKSQVRAVIRLSGVVGTARIEREIQEPGRPGMLGIVPESELRNP